MPTTYQPTVNIPFHMTLKYVDVWPNDTTKNNGKGYGPSLSLRGTIDGEDVRVYPKGFLDANLSGMVNAGIIAAPETGDFDYDPQAKYSIPVRHPEIVMTIAQPAGQKHPKTVFATNGQAPVQRAVTNPPQSKPAPSTGPYVPGLDEAPHPAETSTPGTGAAQSESPAKAMLRLYRECFTEGVRVVKALNDDPGIGLEFTADNVCSITSTLFIEANKKGLRSLAA